MAPASTGRDRSNKMAVRSTDHTNSGNFSIDMPSDRILMVVEMKFTAPRIDLTPARCNEKMVISTDPPEWAIEFDSGG